MANERTYPCLPCADVDRSVAFYRAELAIRTDDPGLARASLVAARSLGLTGDDEAGLADEFAHVAEILDPA